MPYAIGFAAQPLDRADPLRRDTALLQEAWDNPEARFLVMDALVPVTEGTALKWQRRPLGAELSDHLFLGLLEGSPCFVPVDLTGDPDPSQTHSRTWEAIALLGPDDQAILGVVRSLMNWHRLHPFCPRCGGKTALAKGGWQRNCTQCSAEHFPRVDPVVIMLVEHEGRLLLGRQRHYSAGRYSALAGFLEAGETVEQAVVREVFEEAGARVSNVRYIASQPWPFPAQLMIACIGTAQSAELRVDHSEIEDARWFTRDEVAAAMRGDANSPFVAPPKQAVAHMMLRWWLENES